MKLIVRDQPMKTDGRVENVPWIPLLASLSMWLCCATQWFTNIGWAFLISWAPRYLADVHELGVEQRGLYLMFPPLFGWLGMLSGGFFTDRATQWFGLRWGRAIPIGGSRFLAMGAYFICLLQPTPVVVIGLFCVVSFATGLGTPSIWAYNQDVGGKYVGSVLGWGNMWGNLGAAVTPPLLIWIIGPGMNWNYAFVACASAFFLAGLAGLGINANQPIDRPQSPPPSSQ